MGADSGLTETFHTASCPGPDSVPKDQALGCLFLGGPSLARFASELVQKLSKTHPNDSVTLIPPLTSKEPIMKLKSLIATAALAFGFSFASTQPVEARYFECENPNYVACMGSCTSGGASYQFCKGVCCF